jgi:hypothetical protein
MNKYKTHEKKLLPNFRSLLLFRVKQERIYIHALRSEEKIFILKHILSISS